MRTARLALCVGLLAAGCALAAAAAKDTDAKARDPQKATIVHSVYFWLKDTATEQDTKALIRDSKALLGPLPCVLQLDVGRPLGKARGAVDGSYHVGLVVYFADQAGYDAYVKHPSHLKLVEKYKTLWEKIVVYDFVRK